MKNVESVIDDLLNTNLTFSELAEKYNVTRATIYNINNGKTHRKKDLVYPLREVRTAQILTDSESSFITHYKKQYNCKQLHFILGKGTYSNISTVISKGLQDNYIQDEVLELRRHVLDLIMTPQPSFIHTIDTQLDLRDAQYIKFMGRFGVPLEKILELYLFNITMEKPGAYYPITTIEDICKYLEWGGTSSRIIWFIRNIYSNRFNCFNNIQIYWDDFNLQCFAAILEPQEMKILESMVNLDTRENYRRRPR